MEYTRQDVKERLISKVVYTDKEIDDCLKKIIELKDVKNENKIIDKKIKNAEQFVKLIKPVFPDITMVAITGSVAAGYPKPEDDIDLMIVTRSNRLWINRLMLRLYVSLHKIPHRKFGLKENKDDLCFNLWIEESEMRLPKSKQTLRNAMDTILMVPILNKDKTYENFLAENDWVSKFVANGYRGILGNFKIGKRSSRSKFDPLSIINWLVFWPQWWYMKRKISSEVVGLRSAFFHPSDRIRYVSEDNW